MNIYGIIQTYKWQIVRLLYCTYVESKTVIRMHHEVYEFYKPLGLQPQTFEFIKFIDSMVHVYD